MEQSKKNNLWEEIGNRCLQHANELLKKETAPTAATVETVYKLSSIAIAMDELNLRWAEQNRFGAQVFRGQLSSQQATKS